MPNREHRTHYRKVTRRDLTDRQREVLALIAKGLTNAEIGARLGISLDGAKYHVTEILERLEVESREEAADWWREQNTLSERLTAIGSTIGGAIGWKPATVAAGAAGLAGAGLVALVVLSRGDGAPVDDDGTPTGAGEITAAATLSPSPTVPPTATPSPTPGITDPEQVAASFREFALEVDARLRAGDASILTDALITQHIVCTAENTPPRAIGGPDCQNVGDEWQGVDWGNLFEGSIVPLEFAIERFEDLAESSLPEASDEYGEGTFRVFAFTTGPVSGSAVLTVLIERPPEYPGTEPLRVAIDTSWVLWGEEWRLGWVNMTALVERLLDPTAEEFIYDPAEYELFEP